MRAIDFDGPNIEEDPARRREFERARMGVPLHEIKAWGDSWGTANERPPPKARRIERFMFRRKLARTSSGVREFLSVNNPEAAKRAWQTIFAALQRLEEFPALCRPTRPPDLPVMFCVFEAANIALGPKQG